MLYYIGNLESFDKIIAQKITFCLFTAQWCKPCKLIKPVFTKIAENNSNVNFAIIDIDTFSSLQEKYFINSVPTILIFKSNVFTKKLDNLNTFNLKQLLESYMD